MRAGQQKTNMLLILVVGTVYAFSLMLALWVFSLGSANASEARENAAALQKPLQEVAMTDIRRRALLADARYRVRTAKLRIQTLCSTRARTDTPESTLLVLTDRITNALERRATVSSYALAEATPTPPPVQTAGGNALPKIMADAIHSAPTASATPSPTPVPTSAPAAAVTQTVTSGAQLKLTLHGPTPVIFTALDRLTHRDDTMIYNLSSVTRATDGLADVKISVFPDTLPEGLCN